MENALNDMAKLAIKGHQTRGKEVIEILKKLGGRKAGYSGRNFQYYYYIDNFGNIMGTTELPNDIIFKVFTLEEFLEKFPYKVGDKVRIPDYESEIRISSMHWDGFNVQYEVVTDEIEWYSTEELNDFNEPSKEETMEKEISGAIVDRFICLEGYDFYDDKGNIINTKEIIMKKKKPKYPKTYEECCKVLQMPKDESYIDIDVPLSYNKVLKAFTQLLICRDAYWKIAGDWKPNFNDETIKFVITNYRGDVYTSIINNYNRILSFPTEEMRDAFYENFKELIEECKELL